MRPAGDRFRTPAQVSGRLRGDDFRLYELIWKRTVASQMADARGSTASVRLQATATDGRVAEFGASGTVITFRGFLAAYEEGRDEQRGEDRDAERRLPAMSVGDALGTRGIEADGHETSPPPRFTEASLVKALEERGIGRPSTYASTISTISDRGYVTTRGNALVPSWLAFAVTRLLEEHFPRLVDYDFTAAMEGDLDKIAGGDQDRVEWLQRFYFGDQQGIEGLKGLADDLDEIDARQVSTVELGEGVVVRVGRYGPYVEVTGDDGQPQRATVPDDIAPDEMTVEKAREPAHDERRRGPHPRRRPGHRAPDRGQGRSLRAVRHRACCPSRRPSPSRRPTPSRRRRRRRRRPDRSRAPPACSRTCRPSRSPSTTRCGCSRCPAWSAPTRRPATRSPPRTAATARTSRRAPTRARSSPRTRLFTVTLDEALKIYAEPKRRGRAAQPPLKELGPDPVSGGQVSVKDGRFGPYVTDGEVNATLRKDDDPDTITIERAAEPAGRQAGPRTGEEDRQARPGQEGGRQEDHGEEGDDQEDRREEDDHQEGHRRAVAGRRRPPVDGWWRSVHRTTGVSARSRRLFAWSNPALAPPTRRLPRRSPRPSSRRPTTTCAPCWRSRRSVGCGSHSA
ncbi:hypothetical protein GCM10025868_18430 [Angustibacter aerolatus]|uniref:Topo IA-type catalytic domain-containing protein n=1 Tax=Angustibacter aerolatus TaxID=1162965 RepID=A0ABQ6JEK6_9ACTN|nr:hypothetical protein GCM10025868_18430 [Angustibacter aerolatus]